MDTIQKSRNDTPLLPLPAPELEKLSIFIGNWHAEGDSYGARQSEESPYASAVKWVSDETYEWMSGNYFLIHRWDANVGGRNFKGLEILGYDVAKKEYFTRMFDNGGNAIKYKVIIDGNTWRFTEPFTRTTIDFSDDNNAMSFRWEWRQEGGDWLPLCNRKAVRKS